MPEMRENFAIAHIQKPGSEIIWVTGGEGTENTTEWFDFLNPPPPFATEKSPGPGRDNGRTYNLHKTISGPKLPIGFQKHCIINMKSPKHIAILNGGDDGLWNMKNQTLIVDTSTVDIQESVHITLYREIFVDLHILLHKLSV